MSPTLDLTDLEDTETWSATGRDSGTGCSVGVLIVCWVSADIAQNDPEMKIPIIDKLLGNILLRKFSK